MTFREKLEQEHPESIGDNFVGGAAGCPCDYGYEDEYDGMCLEQGKDCAYCWNREMPSGSV